MVERTIRTLGMPWYRRDDWNALLIIFVDATKFPATYDKWRHRAEKAERELERQGMIAERVYLDPAEFAGWCAARGMKVDAAARMNFATEAVTLKYQNQS
jgi:hypothetical protein